MAIYPDKQGETTRDTRRNTGLFFLVSSLFTRRDAGRPGDVRAVNCFSRFLRRSLHRMCHDPILVVEYAATGGLGSTWQCCRVKAHRRFDTCSSHWKPPGAGSLLRDGLALFRDSDGGLVELQRAEIDERKASNELACLIMLDPDQPALGGAGFLTYWSQ